MTFEEIEFPDTPLPEIFSDGELGDDEGTSKPLPTKRRFESSSSSTNINSMQVTSTTSTTLTTAKSNHYKIRIPRLPSDDIRIKYPMMLVNALRDASKLNLFIHQFTHPNSVFIRQIVHPLNPKREIERICFYGPEDIFRYIFALTLINPDRALNMSKSRVVTRSNNKSRTEVILDAEGKTIWFHNTDPIQLGHFLINEKTNNHLPCKDLTTTTSNKKRGNPDSEASSLEHLFHHHFRISNKPLKVQVKVRLTIGISNLSDRHEIDEMCFTSYGLYQSAETIELPQRQQLIMNGSN
eukprot:gene12028-13139_t